MSELSIFNFHSNNIRFKNQNGCVWVNLNDMAKASVKRIDNWQRLSSTVEFLTALKHSLRSEVMVSNVGGSPETTGTWAIEEVAIKFAAWCSVEFEIWMLQQIKDLMNKGFVSLKPKTALELAKEQVKLLEQIEIQNQIIASQEKDLIRQSEMIDELFDYSSIIRVAKFNKVSETNFSWLFLKTTSKAMNLEIKKAPCPRYGTKNLYSHDVWRYCYPNFQLPETTTLVIHS